MRRLSTEGVEQLHTEAPNVDMKDERKTKKQLIEELDDLREKVARVDVSGVERQLAVENTDASRSDGDAFQ